MGINTSRAIDRRAFLGRTGAIAGAAALGATGLSRVRPAAAQDTIKLSWLSDLDGALVVADAYNALGLGVEIEVETVTFREVFQQNQVRLGSKSDNPDIVSVDAPLNTSYGLRGWLMPLDDVIGDEQRAGWVEAQLGSSIYNDQLISAPVVNSSQLLFYNVDMLEAAGVTPPAIDERWTWEQLGEAAQQLTNGTVFGFQFEQYNRIYQLQPLPQGKGVPVIGEDGLTVKGIIDAPEWIEAFTWYANMHNAWKCSPQGSIDVAELFTNQQLAMCIRGPWAIKSFSELDLPFEWRAAPNPYWGGEVHVPTDSWHLGVNPNSKHIAEAAEFVRWASSLDGSRVWREKDDAWPAQTVLLQEIIDDPANVDWPGKANTVAAAESHYATARPLTPAYLEYEEILSDAFEDMRNGADVADSLTAAADKIDREMAKYRQGWSRVPVSLDAGTLLDR